MLMKVIAITQVETKYTNYILYIASEPQPQGGNELKILSSGIRNICSYIEDILPKGPYPPCLHVADRDLLAGYPRIMGENVGDVGLSYVSVPVE